MGLFRDFKLFFSFKKVINKNKIDLESKFNIRIDNADRLYTVLNIPENLFGEPYNVRKSDIDMISQNYIKDYISELSKYLNSIGLTEMYDFYEPIKKVDKYSYLIVLGYKQLDSVDVNKLLYRILVPSVALISFIILMIYLIKR